MHRPFTTRNAMLNAMTIDVEDYYHVTGFESVIPGPIGIAMRAGWSATDTTASWTSWTPIRPERPFSSWAGWPSASRTGAHESTRGPWVARRGYAHQRVCTPIAAQFRQETQRSLRLLEDLIGARVHGYRAASY